MVSRSNNLRHPRRPELTFWAVFDERGRIWLSTIRGTRAAAQQAWVDEISSPRGPWRGWEKRGYTSRPIQITELRSPRAVHK
jgi:hypothetical protein